MKRKDKLMKKALIKTFRNIDKKTIQDEAWIKVMTDFAEDTKQTFGIPKSIVMPMLQHRGTVFQRRINLLR